MMTIVAPNLEPRIAFSVQNLQEVLEERGFVAKKAASLEEAEAGPIIWVGTVRDEVLKTGGLDVPEAAESFAISEIRRVFDGKSVTPEGARLLAIVGRDETGAMYGALELAEAIKAQIGDLDPFSLLSEKSSSPLLKVRGINFYLTLEALEDQNSWFHSQDFWQGLFDMMAKCRLNFLDLHGVWRVSDGSIWTNLFPYLVKPPSFPHILATDEARQQKNLETIHTVTRMAKERGVEVCLANQMADVYSRWVSAGLSEQELAQYTRECVAALLQSCPHLAALGIRLSESGKEENFYRESYLQGIADSGRLIRLIIRTWGATKEKIEEIAREYPGPLSVEIKYNGEHLGLPYQAVTEEAQQGLAYGKVAPSYTYQDYTVGPRNYSIIWQLRANGTHRLFHWGDPDFVRRCVNSCLLGDGVGFSLECLSAMVYQEDFCHSAQTANHIFYRFNYQRDWLWYLLWGRLAYHPQTPEQVWLAEFERRFGPAGLSLYQAYCHASKVVPLVYSFHKSGMDSRNMAPEFERGGDLVETVQAIPLDPNTFQSVPEYVANCLQNRSSGRKSPVQVSDSLAEAADESLNYLRQAESLLASPNREFECTRMDFEAVACLARYYREKILAATHLKFFFASGDPSRLHLARAHTRQSHRHWNGLVRVTEQHYRPFYDFRLGVFHWSQYVRHRPDSLQQDLSLLEAISAEESPQVEHTPVASALLNRPLQITATSQGDIAWARLHFKPIPTTYRWNWLPMAVDNGVLSATIPSSSVTVDGLMYYLEFADKNGNAALFPDPDKETPYIIVSVSE